MYSVEHGTLAFAIHHDISQTLVLCSPHPAIKRVHRRIARAWSEVGYS